MRVLEKSLKRLDHAMKGIDRAQGRASGKIGGAANARTRRSVSPKAAPGGAVRARARTRRSVSPRGGGAPHVGKTLAGIGAVTLGVKKQGTAARKTSAAERALAASERKAAVAAKAQARESAKVSKALEKQRRKARRLAEQQRKAQRARLGRLGAGARGGASAGGLGRVAGLVGAGGPAAIAAAVGVAAAVGGAVVAVKATNEIKNIAKEAESLDLAFEKLTRDGPATLRRVQATAQELGLDVLKVGDSYRQLLARGFDIEDAETFTKLGADLQIVGVSADRVNSVLKQVAKIQSQGKLQGDEMMIMAEAGLNLKKVYESIGEAMGKTSSEVIKLQSEGKLTADIAIPAIKKAMLAIAGVEKAGDGAKQAMDTLAGAERSVGAAFTNLKLKIAKATGGADLFAGVFKMIKKRIDAITPEQIEKIGAVFKRITDQIEIAIGFAFDFVDGFLEGFGVLNVEGADFKEIMKGLGPLFRQLGENIGRMAKMAQLALYPLIKQLELISKLVGFLDEFGALQLLTNPGAAIGEALVRRVFGPDEATAGKSKETFDQRQERLLRATGGEMVDSTVGGMRDAAGMHSPSKVFRKLGKNMAQSTASGTAEGAGLRYSSAGGASSPGMGSPEGGGGGATVVTIAPQIAINGAGDPGAVATEVKRVLVSELGMAFDRISTQQGAA